MENSLVKRASALRARSLGTLGCNPGPAVSGVVSSAVASGSKPADKEPSEVPNAIEQFYAKLLPALEVCLLVEPPQLSSVSAFLCNKN
jgi:hypothetical protein